MPWVFIGVCMKNFLNLILVICFVLTGCADNSKGDNELLFSEIEELFLKSVDSDFGYCTVTDYYISNYFPDIEGIKACEIYKCNDSINFDEFGIFEFPNALKV